VSRLQQIWVLASRPWASGLPTVVLLSLPRFPSLIWRLNERLRQENRVLKEESDILKKAQGSMGSSSPRNGHEVRIH
jgi:hypothetical protein